jgi:hypothetical protein
LAFKRFPQIREAYSAYILCRQQNVIVWESSPSKDKTQVHIVPFTVGLAQLPYAGGVEDQPYRMMEFFSEFMDAERNVFFNTKH